MVTSETTGGAAPVDLNRLEAGFKTCRKATKAAFADYTWVLGNLSGDSRNRVWTLGAFLARALELLDTNVAPLARKQEWSEWREQLTDAFRGRGCSDDLYALAQVAHELQIAREYFFDIQAGVELAIRCKKFEAFDQWHQMGTRIGGSAVLALAPILGLEKSGYESAALACGEAIFLTQLLDAMGNNHHNILQFAPRMIARKCNVHLEALNPKRPGIEFIRFVRTLVARTEPFFNKGGKLVEYLDFDGKRVMKSLIAVNWDLLIHIKHSPEAIMQQRHQLTHGELLGFRLKHLLGTEGKVSVIPDGHPHH